MRQMLSPKETPDMKPAEMRALVIGAGNIGALYDTPESPEILTHAHAYHRSAEFVLAGFLDADPAKGALAAKRWGGQCFSSLHEAFAQGRIDVVSVAVPDELHFSVLKELADYQPGMIFCEKPVATSNAEIEELLKIFGGKDTLVAVNYLRRYVDEYILVKKAISSGIYGPFLFGTGYFTGGFLHNGSHMVDLLRDWLGEIIRVEKKEESFDKKDRKVEPSRTFFFENGGAFVMRTFPGEPFWIFEADLFFKKKRIRMIDSGFQIEEHDVRENDLFKGSMDISRTNTRSTSLSSGMEQAVNNLKIALEGKGQLRCPLPDACQTMRVCLEAL